MRRCTGSGASTRRAFAGYKRAVEPRLNFVTLVVADLSRARRFYLAPDRGAPPQTPAGLAGSRFEGLE